MDSNNNNNNYYYYSSPPNQPNQPNQPYQPNQPFNQPMYQPKRRGRLAVSTDSKDELFSAVFLAFSIVASWLVFWGGFRAGYVVANLAMLVITSIYSFKNGAKNKDKLFPFLCAVASVAVSIPLALRHDYTIAPVSVLATICLDGVYFYGLFGTPKRGYSDLRMIGDVLERTFGQTLKRLFVPWRSMSRSRTGEKRPRSKSLGTVLLGIFIALPLVLVLTVLLSESDAAFEALIGRLLQGGKELIYVIIVGFICYPFLFSYAFSLRKRLDSDEYCRPLREKNYHVIDQTVINTVLLIVSTLYAVYLFSQLSYLFNAFSGMLPEKFSYAQYARRGFFELCVIAGINLVLVFFALALTKLKENGKVSALTRGTALYICLFTLMIIATALSKMYMYIGQYGMTRRRILVSCFMVFMAVCFVAAIIRVFACGFPYMKLLVLAAAVILVSVSVADIDSVITRHNIEAFLSGETQELDVDELRFLGAGSTAVIADYLDSENTALKRVANYLMLERAGSYYEIDVDKGTYKPRENHFSLNSFTLDEYRERKIVVGCIDSLSLEDYTFNDISIDCQTVKYLSNKQAGTLCFKDCFLIHCDTVYVTRDNSTDSVLELQRKYSLPLTESTDKVFDNYYGEKKLLFYKGKELVKVIALEDSVTLEGVGDRFSFDTVFNVKLTEEEECSITYVVNAKLTVKE